MARSHGKRLVWNQARRIAVIVPIAAAIAAPILPAQAKTPHVTPLKLIMNPQGHKPVGTECTTALLFGLKKKTLIARIFCAKTTGKNIVVWGYQFNSKKHYLAGVAHINSYTGFSDMHDSHTCPPSGGKKSGITGWHANSNKKYKARPGQFIECFIDNGKPVLIWTMPTQHVFFIGQYHLAGGTITKIINWWKTVNYG
ncbi:MAG TPA: hypothetical protein VFI65_24125 [Streptosporangiaceae bacterium]|nr:hypothetical protein [Streptosporangiaceae bacterium]